MNQEKKGQDSNEALDRVGELAPKGSAGGLHPGKPQEVIEPAQLDPLTLPPGAMVALRKSGGLRFTTRTAIVFPDGRVMPGEEKERKPVRRARKLGDGQIMRLRRGLDKAGFFKMSSPPAKLKSDAYVYELAARAGNRTNTLELVQGSIPGALKGVVEELEGLLEGESGGQESAARL